MDKSTRFGVPRELLAQRQNGVRAISASSTPRIQFSTGTAKALRDFSFDMFNQSNKLEDQLDDVAVAEATNEGAIDGAGGQLELRDYSTIRGRAYNKAGTDTFVATMETRSIQQVAALRQQYAGDPAGLERALNDYHAGVRAEIDKISPGAGVQYNHRATMRTMPAIEQAKDYAYKLSKEQAEAAMISSQIALDAEITEHSADLFSENPDRSNAAAAAISVVGQQMMRVYSAVDPVTNRPLYSPKERAAAQAAFREDVFKKATLSWFDGQENKAEAYTKFMEGNFTFDLNVKGVDTGKASPTVVNAMQQAANANNVAFEDLAVIAHIETGGTFNPKAKNPKSTAGGLFQFIDSTAAAYGLTNKNDPVQASHAAARFMNANREQLEGALGRKVGVAELYLAHQQGAGGAVALLSNPNAKASSIVGSAAVKLNGGTADMTAQQFANIWMRKANKVAQQQQTNKVDIRKAMSEKATIALDKEMRARITFSNTQRDRADRAEAKQVAADQDLTFFTATDGILAGDGSVSRETVQAGIDDQSINPTDGRALLKMLAEDPAEKTDTDFEKELIARMYAGEDVSRDIIGGSARLTSADMKSLLGKNKTMNIDGDGSLTKAQKFQFDGLKDLLTPDSLMAAVDPNAEARKFDALDEFMQRVDEGEDAREVAAGLKERAARDWETMSGTALDRLVKPRFSVGVQGGKINITASIKALRAAKAAGNISEASYGRQAALLLQWKEIQEGLK